MADRRGKVEAVTNFILGDSKITADNDCSHEIKRHLILGRRNTCSNIKTKQNKTKQNKKLVPKLKDTFSLEEKL